MSPVANGAKSSSPGPVYVLCAISPRTSSFFILNFRLPFSCMVGDMAIMTPGRAVSGHPIASCIVKIVLVSRCEMR